MNVHYFITIKLTTYTILSIYTLKRIIIAILYNFALYLLGTAVKSKTMRLASRITYRLLT
jgi:hypothetical protein